MRAPTDRELAAATAVLAAVHVARAWQALPSLVDDAYISARYAMHLALGNGLVYNAGEPPIEGYTNLLWVLETALAWKLAGADPTDMHAVLVGNGVVHGVLGVVAVTALARALCGQPAWAVLVPALWLALDPHYAVVATNGIESVQFLAFVSGALAAVIATEGRTGPVRAIPAALCALLVAVRPEGLAVAGTIAAYDVWTRRAAWRAPATWTVAAGYLAGVVPVWLGRLWYFGDIFPNTWRAKGHKDLLDQIEFNLVYLSPDWPFWVAVALFLAASLLPPYDRRRLVALAVALGIVAIAFQVDMWMPGGRLLLPAVAVIFALLVDRLRALPAVASGATVVLFAALLGAGVVPRHVFRYDQKHTALPDNGAERAALHVARHAPPGAVVSIRDAGVFAYFVGPDVIVAETHERALTRPHPGGADAAVLSYVPANPEVVVTTVQRVDAANTTKYTPDRGVFNRLSAPYRYLGRVEQHYHRYYDVYVRDDVPIPSFPPGLAVNFKGPPPPHPAE